MSERIPFNSWSKERIKQGRKFCTSRKRVWDDSRVVGVIYLDWGTIKNVLWRAEGADSADELQGEIDKIFGRKVNDYEMFHAHFGNFKERERA